MSLSDIAKQIEGFAAAAVAEGEKDLEAFVQKAEQIGEEAAVAVEPVVVTTYHLIVSQFGQLATAVVYSLMGAAGAGLSGTEKANLGATTIVQAAWNAGVTLLSGDASTLLKNAFVAVTDVVKANLPAN